MLPVHERQSGVVQATQTPTRVRYWVIVFAATLAVITYIDRVALSFAAPFISKDLGLDSRHMGLAFTAFGVAYAAFEMPGGYLGDRLGPRSVLMRIVLWWSFFTAATGSTFNFLSIVTTQFLFGAGEAGCFPNLTKTFTTWLPAKERVRAQGIMWLSARWGGAFTPPLVALVMGLVGWRHTFQIFGGLGVIWAVIFYRWYRNNPLDNPKLNAAERELVRTASANARPHGDVPWGKFLHVAAGVDDLPAILLSFLRLVFLHHLAAHLSGEGAPPEREVGGHLRHRCRYSWAASATWPASLSPAGSRPG